MMKTNLFVIANVKQLRTDGSFRILLPFFQTSWSVGVLNSAIFNSFHNRVEFGTILEVLRNFGGGGLFEPPTPPPRYATAFGQFTRGRGWGPWLFFEAKRGPQAKKFGKQWYRRINVPLFDSEAQSKLVPSKYKPSVLKHPTAKFGRH